MVADSNFFLWSDLMPNEVWDDVLDEVRMLMRQTKHLAHRVLVTNEHLQPALAGILGLLVREGEVRLTVVAERQHIGMSAASRQVAELQAMGLVERSPDPDDARASLLQATAAGRDVFERTRQWQVQVLRQVLGEWSEGDAKELAAALTRLNGDLNRHLCGPPGASSVLPPGPRAGEATHPLATA